MSGVAVRANAFHTPTRGRLEVLEDVLIEVSADGVIERVGPATEERLAAAERLTVLPPGHHLLPGLVDLHVHAPQWPQLGRALDVPLEEWLQVHTFPLEARYADVGFAREVYAELVDALLAHGTTTAVYFATIHVEATVALAETCLAKGQRALVGKVAMDDPAECPDYYRDADAGAALAGTRETIARIAALQPDARPLVLPAITPRFLPSCTAPLLAGLGRIARETGCHVQTHVSENAWEVAHGEARFGRSDAAVLADFGLLADHAILAHGNFVDRADRALIRKAGAAVAHCPLSNIYFAGAVLPARAMMDEGLRVGLGTDIAGGHTPSLLESARFAVTASRVLASTEPGAAIDVADAFWMATAGGGEALGLPIGAFTPGFDFDAIAVDVRTLAHPLDTAAGCFEKIVRRAGRAEIAGVWVRGRRVAP